MVGQRGGSGLGGSGGGGGGTAIDTSTGVLHSTTVPALGHWRTMVPGRAVDSARVARPSRSRARSDLHCNVFVPGIQQVRHASPALIGLGRRRRRWRHRNPDVDAHTTVDHRSAIRMLAKDRSFAPRRVGRTARPTRSRSRNLLRRLGIHVADDVWHASRARRRLPAYGDPEIDRRIALDYRSAIRVLPQDRSFTPRRLGANGAPDTQPRSCNLLRRLGEHIVDQIWHASPAGRVRRRHDLNGDRDVHARVAGHDRFWVGRLRDNASSRISSRFDAAHGAEYRGLSPSTRTLPRSPRGSREPCTGRHRLDRCGALVRVPDWPSSRRAVSVPPKGHRRCRPATVARGPDSAAGRPGAAASSADPAQRRRRPAAAGQAVPDAAERVVRVGWEAGRVWRALALSWAATARARCAAAAPLAPAGHRPRELRGPFRRPRAATYSLHAWPAPFAVPIPIGCYEACARLFLRFSLDILRTMNGRCRSPVECLNVEQQAVGSASRARSPRMGPSWSENSRALSYETQLRQWTFTVRMVNVPAPSTAPFVVSENDWWCEEDRVRVANLGELPPNAG